MPKKSISTDSQKKVKLEDSYDDIFKDVDDEVFPEDHADSKEDAE